MSDKYPRVIQLPLTLQCNSRCAMCNVWNMDHSGEMDASELAAHLRDPLFQEVESVGINGGEPTLIEDLPAYAAAILALPSLRSLNLISNGFRTKTLLETAKTIRTLCHERNVAFHLSLSLDGYGEVHDRVRGVPGAFEKTTATIDAVMAELERYCDSFDVGCTVIRQNVDRLMELEAFAKTRGYPMKYRLGIGNKRIESDTLLERFSVLNGPERQSAKEFFHYKMHDATTSRERFRYFAIFHWLDSAVPQRLLGCMWQNEGVTLDGRGNLYYCAVESERLGSLRESGGEALFFDPKHLEYRERLVQEKCDGCIHDYTGPVSTEKQWVYLEEFHSRRQAMACYRIKAGVL